MGGESIAKASELIDRVAELDGRPAELTVQREKKTLRVTVQPVESAEGQWMMGMWLRDGVSGIGTLTFCDPDSGVFGALGHSVSDSDTGLTIPVREGSITDAQIVSVNPGVSGSPGELNG